MEGFKKSLAETQENLVKTQLSVTGLTEMNAQLKLESDDLRSGVETRDEALAILREEYEKLKARYRKKSQVGPLTLNSLNLAKSGWPFKTQKTARWNIFQMHFLEGKGTTARLLQWCPIKLRIFH